MSENASIRRIVFPGRVRYWRAMTNTTPEVSAPPAEGALRRHVEEFILIGLVLLGAIGVAINDYSPQSAFRYWLWMAPTFGVISTAEAWWRAQRRGESVAAAVQRQMLHWAAVVAAVYLVYLLQSTGRMANEAAGLAALIVIALASFLAGVHGDWRLLVVGAVLGIIVVGFAVLERVLWIVAIPALVIIVLAVAVYARTRG
jgi:hypothetical protein